MKPIERFLRETDRVPLMPMPTPLHPMHYQPSGKDVSLLIKRDDMTGVGPGGNKIRSLEFLLGEARSKGASKILAAGPEQSNLCALTAAACAKAGLDCELIINAAEPARKEGNLLLEELLGTKIHFLGPCDGTVLIYGNQLMGQPFRIVIVSVEDDRETLTAHIRSTISEAEEITGLPMDVPVEQAAEITDAYRGGGWGENTEESQQAVLSFARSEGIFIENVYTSKVLVGMMDWIEQEKVSGPVCYLHTGGLGSLFAQY